MRDWKIIVIVAIVLALLTNAGQFFLWKMNVEGIEEKYQAKIAIMEETINNIGPLMDVYSVREITKSGAEVKQEDLTIVQTPASMINDTYILDPSTVVGKYYKVSLGPGTPLTKDLVMDEKVDDSVREVDIVADTWPIGLSVGDYVDFEITYPLGESYVVLSKKRVQAINKGTIKVLLSGKERHIHGASLVDYFIQKNKGSSINLVKYPEPGIQKEAEVTYSVPENILAVIDSDPNVIKKVEKAINMDRRARIESSMEALDSEEANAIAGGRSTISSAIDGGTNNYQNKLKEKAEQEAWDAFEKAGEQPLNVEKGVVE